MENNRIERSKNCSNCGVAFSCYTKDCWCAELPMIMPLDSASDCLCPKCLKKVIDLKLKEKGAE